MIETPNQKVETDAFKQDAKNVSSFVVNALGKVKEFIRQNPKRVLKYALIAAGVVVLIILLITLSIFAAGKSANKVSSSSPTPAARITGADVANPSRYATDSAVLEIEKGINAQIEILDKMDTFLSELTPPKLKFDLSD